MKTYECKIRFGGAYVDSDVVVALLDSRGFQNIEVSEWRQVKSLRELVAELLEMPADASGSDLACEYAIRSTGQCTQDETRQINEVDKLLEFKLSLHETLLALRGME